MKLHVVVCFLLIPFLVPALFATDEPVLSAREIVERAVERAESPAVHESRSQYRYLRLTTSAQLDNKGRLVEEKEKVHAVSLQSGKPSLLSVRVNGRPIPPDRLRAEEEKEASSRKHYSNSNTNGRSDHFEKILSPDLVVRYDWSLAGTELIGGRRSLVLDFKPKDGLDVKQMMDRLLNKLEGRIWIDAEDYELAKAQVTLQGEVKFWGGLLASIRNLDLRLVRTRLEDGTWFNRSSVANFDGRKLFDSINVRVETVSSDFRKDSAG